MRYVLDANVVVAAMRSPSGASVFLLMAAGLTQQEVEIFVAAVIAMAEPVESHFMWRPQLRDANDEMVLEAAVNGRAAAIVTFNRGDFGAIPSRFGVDVLLPIEAVRRIAS